MDYFGYDPALLAYFQDPTMMAEDLRAAGIKYQPQNDIAVDPALQQFPAPVQQFNFVPANFFLGNQVMNAPVAPQAQMTTEAAPVVAQEPIAQGVQSNVGDLGVVYPAPADIAPVATPPKGEQVPDFAHDNSENESDAEGEPADPQLPAGLPAVVPMDPAAVEALVRLRALSSNHLAQAIVQLQEELNTRENNHAMANDEMDVDQPEQIDGIPAFADGPLFGPNGIQDDDNTDTRTIYDIPLPDHSSVFSRERYLITCRELGFTYRQIKEVGGFTEAESTLRGRYRTLTKAPQDRLRKPVWEQKDVVILRQVTYGWYTANNRTLDARPPWKQIAKDMVQWGASYHFGPGTIAKMWKAVHDIDVDNFKKAN